MEGKMDELMDDLLNNFITLRILPLPPSLPPSLPHRSLPMPKIYIRPSIDREADHATIAYRPLRLQV